MTLTDKVVRRSDIVAVNMNDELVMMDIQSGKYFDMKGPAADIWKMLESEMTIESVVDKLMSLYDVERDECMKDTVAFLEQLESRKLIVVS